MNRGAVTFGDIDEEPPGPVSIEPPPEHDIETGWCWCQPKVIYRPPNGEIVVHRRMMDGPVFEDEEMASTVV